jgi:hypothetical protein
VSFEVLSAKARETVNGALNKGATDIDSMTNIASDEAQLQAEKKGQKGTERKQHAPSLPKQQRSFSWCGCRSLPPVRLFCFSLALAPTAIKEATNDALSKVRAAAQVVDGLDSDEKYDSKADGYGSGGYSSGGYSGEYSARDRLLLEHLSCSTNGAYSPVPYYSSVSGNVKQSLSAVAPASYPVMSDSYGAGSSGATVTVAVTCNLKVKAC